MLRIVSICLTALLAVSLLSGVPASGTASEDRCWEAIRSIEDRALEVCGTQGEQTLAASFASRVDEMIRSVKAAPDYVDGSLERHGNFFFWETSDGRANGYSPSLRAELRSRSGERAETAAEIPPLYKSGSDTANIPDSRDVGVVVPYSGSYYFHAENCIAEAAELARSTGGSLHVCTAENTNVDTLAEVIETCGIVLINSHGRTDYELMDDHTSRANSSYICLPTDQGVTAEDQKPVTGRYGTYRHAYYAGPSEDFDEEYYCVDGTCIANHMKQQAPHSMVWLGFCLGMATEGMFAPLQSMGVEAMVGFSERVTTNADQEYRAAMVQAMLEDADVGKAVAAMKEEVGCPDPYQPSHAPAWPIAVSSLDTYPGREHLTEGQEVHSDWKLYPADPISVTVEPAGTADISVVRHRVIVTPHRGYTFDGWTVTEGAPEVSRSGDVLDFTLYGPCAVTVQMADRIPASVTFFLGPGQTAPEINEFVGDTVLLPEPEGELQADAFVYHFLGWSRENPETDSEALPVLSKPGARLTLTEPETVFYGVYGYFEPEDGVSRGQFRLVEEAPADWAGDYVLTYNSTKALKASSQHTGSGIMSPLAVASCEKDGYFVDGIWLNEVPEELVYSFLPNESGDGLLKMKTSENYLAIPSSNVLLSTLTDPTAAGTRWRMKWQDGAVRVTSARFTSRVLQYSPTSSGFCTLTSNRTGLTVYARVPGRHLYTTRPRSQTPEPPLPDFRFLDVTDPDSYYFRPVYWALYHDPQITAGASEEYFLPDGLCTRAQALTWLWRSAGCPEPESLNSPFLDVHGGNRYKAILWAAEQGITRGTTRLLFSPNRTCTRGQFLTFLWRYLQRPDPGSEELPYRDVGEKLYYRNPICWAVRAGVALGIGPEIFGPDRTLSRAQALSFLFRALNF